MMEFAGDAEWTVDEAMRRMAAARRHVDFETRYAMTQGDNLARFLSSKHPVEELPTIGTGLLRSASCIAGLLAGTIQADPALVPQLRAAVAVTNILAFAGDRIVRDGRDTFGAMFGGGG